MKKVEINGVELEYEVFGSGEPVLLINPVLADGLLPLVSRPALADRYRLIHYHKRGWARSTHTPAPVSIADHAADAASLLAHLGVPRAHVVGHSSGAAVAAQLALDAPERVHALILLELTLFSVPSGEALLREAGPAIEAFGRGDHESAVALFLSAVSGLEWPACRALLDERLPGAAAGAVADADTLFAVELPAVAGWVLGPERAAAIASPVLSVTGSRTGPLWVEVADFLRRSLSDAEHSTIDGVGHLLQIERPDPVAREIARFLDANPMLGALRSGALPAGVDRGAARRAS